MKKSEFEKLKKGDVVTIRTKEELVLVKRVVGVSQDNLHLIDDDGKEIKLPFTFSGKKAIVVNEHWSKTAVLVKVCNKHLIVVVRQHLKGGK